jgi:AcrR family transcriptional regulator
MKKETQWLESGLDVLVASGLEALTIDGICRTLGKTKGSFYHHFANRDDYLHRMLTFWEKHHTQDLIERTSAIERPSEALKELHRLTRALSFERETALRDWAARSDEAAAVVKRVDLARASHLAKLYVLQGSSPEQAQTLAWLNYALFLGASALGETLPSAQRKRIKDGLQRGAFAHD